MQDRTDEEIVTERYPTTNAGQLHTELQCVLEHIFLEFLLLYQLQQCSFLRKLRQWVPWEQKKLFPSFGRYLESFQSVAEEKARRRRWEHVLARQGAARRSRKQLRGSEESILGTTGAEFCFHSELTQAGNTDLSVGMNLTEITRNLFYFYYWWWFLRGTKARGMLVWGLLGFFKLTIFNFICLNENWFSLNYNTTRLIQKAEIIFFFSGSHSRGNI